MLCVACRNFNLTAIGACLELFSMRQFEQTALAVVRAWRMLPSCSEAFDSGISTCLTMLEHVRSDHVGLLINNTTCPASHAAAATVQLLRSAGRNACCSLQASLCALVVHDMSDWLLCELVYLHVAQWRLQQARRDTLHTTSRSESRLVRTGAAEAVNIGKLPFLGHSKAQTRD